MTAYLRRCYMTLLALAAVLATGSCSQPNVFRVVVTIAPIHGLVSAVMEGVDTPHLLLGARTSPHSFSLRPSEARFVAETDLVIWVGPSLESSVAKAINNKTLGKTLTLSEHTGLTLLPFSDDQHGHQLAIDPHIWLMPQNAVEILTIVETALIELDPVHGSAYRANAQRARERLIALGQDIESELAPLSDQPYVVFHNAYRYFEKAMNLHGSIYVKHRVDLPIGAGAMSELNRRLDGQDIKCIFHEPQLDDRLLQAITKSTGLNTFLLDPLGSEIDPGPDHYFTLLRKLGDAFAQCLTKDTSTRD